MKIRNTIIKCELKDLISLQKFLFSLKFSWLETTAYSNVLKHRHIKDFKWIIKNYPDFPAQYFIIKHDDTFVCEPKISDRKDLNNFKIIEYNQLVRKIKMEKINKN